MPGAMVSFVSGRVLYVSWESGRVQRRRYWLLDKECKGVKRGRRLSEEFYENAAESSKRIDGLVLAKEGGCGCFGCANGSKRVRVQLAGRFNPAVNVSLIGPPPVRLIVAR